MLQYFQMENPSIKLNAETKQLYYTRMYTIHQKTQYTTGYIHCKNHHKWKKCSRVIDDGLLCSKFVL